MYSVKKSIKTNPYGNQIISRYDAGGQKLSTEYLTLKTPLSVPLSQGEVRIWVYNSTLMSSSGQAYVGNMEYGRVKNNNGSFWTGLNKIHHTEGYVTQYPNGGYVAPNYHYYRKDHLGSTREVWRAPYVVYVANNIVNPASTVQRTLYYPSGLPWAEGERANEQQRKYNGKEWIEAHGLDEYDSQARMYYPAIMRTTTIDLLAEKYYHISPYAWCGNNPVNAVDPDGMDYWSTSDPTLIRAFFNSMGGGFNSHDFSRWNHIEDSKFIRDYKATFNDETGKFYTSYGRIEDGVLTSVGVTFDTNISPGLNSFGLPYEGLQIYSPIGNDFWSKSAYHIFGQNASYDVGRLSWGINTSGRITGLQPLTGAPDLIGGTSFKGGKFVLKMGKAKGNMPANRIIQNRDAKRIAKELGLKTEKERRQLHDLISGQGYNYNQALKEAKAFFGK